MSLYPFHAKIKAMNERIVVSRKGRLESYADSRLQSTHSLVVGWGFVAQEEVGDR